MRCKCNLIIDFCLTGDHSRVLLGSLANDYINASFVEVCPVFKFQITRFFYKQYLKATLGWKLGKSQANAKQHSEAELLPFENYSHSSSLLSSKKQACLYSWDYAINHKETEDENEK